MLAEIGRPSKEKYAPPCNRKWRSLGKNCERSVRVRKKKQGGGQKELSKRGRERGGRGRREAFPEKSKEFFLCTPRIGK